MRYTGHNGNDRYNLAGRPPLEALSTDLATLITEYDAAQTRVRAAERERDRLAQPERDDEARQADAAAAAAAARAGKKIPPATAAAKLAADRDESVRTVDAHRAAVKAIRDDLDAARDAALQTATGPSEKDRDRVAKTAADFVAVLEQAIADRAAYDWLRGRTYEPNAQTWAVDLVPALKNRAIDRSNDTIVNARTVVTNLVNALMED
ncbi:hypothetical protein D1O33_03410 [Rhodococcus rhodochrous]|uniref:hypothetical protein n=1 Tax=Rhodococcus TaxID=1827 RepID=UPI000B5A9B0B|nr:MULTISPECIES: hypothetical protein [Rhodococcus]OWY81744.1 hypothetical protein B9C99_10265 [Rhodococcus sp. BUPNP1]QHG81091.1 hypothetical protein D1O33_03410 [Rhodococcus rhodochrous]